MSGEVRIERLGWVTWYVTVTDPDNCLVAASWATLGSRRGAERSARRHLRRRARNKRDSYSYTPPDGSGANG